MNLGLVSMKKRIFPVKLLGNFKSVSLSLSRSPPLKVVSTSDPKANKPILMKNLFAMTAALMMGFGATASNVELVVEAVDNNGTVPGNTYRVYAVLPSAQHSLHAVFAAEDLSLIHI